jgi:cupin-like protein
VRTRNDCVRFRSLAVPDVGAGIDRLTAGEGEAFEQRSDSLRAPVHIRGLSEGFAPAAWSLDHLRARAGDCAFRVSRNDDAGRWVVNKDGRGGVDWEDVQLADFLDVLLQGNPRRLYAGSIPIENLQPLRDDAEQAPFLRWAGDPEPVRIRFWLGRDNATQLHYDLFHTFLAPIIGSKDVWLFAPTTIDDFYPMQDPRNRNVSQIGSPKSFDPDAFPAFSSKAPIRLTLSPGEVLFMPIYWWHYVEAGPEVNVALSYHFARPTVETIRSEYLLHYVRGQQGGESSPGAEN